MKTKRLFSADAVLLILTMSLFVSIAATSPTAIALQDEAAALGMNKGHYCYNEIVTISGMAFQPETLITITVTLPDASTDSWSDVTSDTNGDFITDYTLGDLVGRYNIEATDGITTVERIFEVIQWIIDTDKSNYAPDETVTVFGYGFEPNGAITITVTRPDSETDIWSVNTGNFGNFTTLYPLNGITGEYLVTATDGTKEATTTFTDTSFSVSITEGAIGQTVRVVVDGWWMLNDAPSVYFDGSKVADCTPMIFEEYKWDATFPVPNVGIGAGHQIKVKIPDPWIDNIWCSDTSCWSIDCRDGGLLCSDCDYDECYEGCCSCLCAGLWVYNIFSGKCGCVGIKECIPFICDMIYHSYYWLGPIYFEVLPDSDGDTIADKNDVCPNDSANDEDNDGLCAGTGWKPPKTGDQDPCPIDPENDADGDGVCGDVDNCPYDPENDADEDGVCGDVDNCPHASNPGQEDADGDGIGDVCDVTAASLFSDTLLILPVVVLTGTLMIHRRRRKYSPQN